MFRITDIHKHLSRITDPWVAPLSAVILGLAMVSWLYWDTLYSIIEIWIRSQTFAHGFLIFPISLWLIFRKRALVATLSPQPDPAALPILVLIVGVWILAEISEVLVVSQLAWVAMLPAMIWLILGRTIAWELGFPLGFLFFMVPVGEFLIPYLMDFTAAFTVKMLRLSGIPVYQQGTFFSIPSGEWSVVEACSGLRYLISSITLGCLYAYLSYQRLAYRITFVVLAILFPVLANGLRAYIIVILAHLSDYKLATGVDHYVYGWVFFGFVMLVMFWIGSFWREAEPFNGDSEKQNELPAIRNRLHEDWKYWGITLTGILLTGLGPLRAMQLEYIAKEHATPVSMAPLQAVFPWKVTGENLAWEPSYRGVDAEIKAQYSDGAHRVDVFLYYYREQKQGEELIGSQNLLTSQASPDWHLLSESLVASKIPGLPGEIRQGILRSQAGRLLIWRWYWVSGEYTANDYWGKWLEARDRFMGRFRDGAALVFATEIATTEQAAQRVLESFLVSMQPALQQTLMDTSQR